MIPKWLFVLSLHFTVEIVSGSSSVIIKGTTSPSVMSSLVSPSSSTTYALGPSQTSLSASSASSDYPSFSSTRPTKSVTSSPVSSSSSSVRMLAASSSLSFPTSPSASPTPSSTSSTGKSTVHVTGSTGPPTQTSTTRPPPATKGKTIGVMEVLGFCLLALIAIALIGFAIYYMTCREQKEDDGLNQPMVEARARDSAQPKETEIGITNEALAGDSNNPTKVEVMAPVPEVMAPVPEVMAQVPTANTSELTTDDNESKQTETDDDGTQDSAL